MEKRYNHSAQEPRIFEFWERRKLFEARISPDKKPFTIILPPPNANADLHVGHAMYVYEDIMIRFNKLRGREVLWLPGFDHAGFETQFVFEKHLKKQGKSRLDFDRETLYQMIWDFVEENKPKMRAQLKRLGFALDWSKERFTIAPEVVRVVYDTFKRLFDAGLLYRKERLVNYCWVDGTSFSDLEVDYVERQTKLWYLKYPVKGEPGAYLTIATTRPETMLGDTAVAVNPKDKRYAGFIGKTLILPVVNREIPVIADEMVDPEFGTGAVKITPAHDENDWQVAQRKNLPLIQVIGFDGRLIQEAGRFAGLKINVAREAILEVLKESGALEKEQDYTHRVGVCYKCGTIIEPLPLEQWFIAIKPLALKAIKRIKDDEITFYPKKFKRQAIQILERYHDWNISRQTVWGIRIPAFRKNGGKWIVELDPEKQKQLLADGFEQDPDTFDTWFSSGQWPFATLLSLDGSTNPSEGGELFKYFYPTSVMETGHDILRAWVARMIMLGDFATGKVPFEQVYLHGMVRDKNGQKMSKSKGNVVNPVEYMDKYGADALRAALIFGTKDGGDTNISEEKTLGMRNFANKIWNIGRFIRMNADWVEEGPKPDAPIFTDKDAKKALKTIEKLEKRAAVVRKQYLIFMSSGKFSKGLELLYKFLWHEFADSYLETLKDAMRSRSDTGKTALKTLQEVYLETLVMLSPFIPFVTEAVWQEFHGQNSSILEAVSLRDLS
ncbi:MAG: valine--tRNA ligase [Patescibacteria group bacterium]|nr:valine--tRNA ligase [Patescibacteria group bacterium]